MNSGDEMDLKEDFIRHLSKFKTAPFLFIGSGISRRYLGLENWENLLRKISALTGQDYNYFKASGNSSLASISEVIAQALHEIWWNSHSFIRVRQKYHRFIKSRDSAFKIEISRYVHRESRQFRRNSKNLSKNLSQEIEYLKMAIIDGVVTTNWDLFLEEIFPDFRVYIGQDELISAAPQSFEEIYKIHGCCTQPNSLVSTESDYQTFMTRNPYLAAKLLTVFMEHPVIFFGYSLNDPNIIEILRSIISCFTTENIDQFSEQLIFVQWKSNPSQYEIRNSNIVAGGFTIPVFTIKTHEFLPIFQALSERKRKYPPKFIRWMQSDQYKLVGKDEPSPKIIFQDIDKIDDLSEAEMVIGKRVVTIISDLSYRGILREDLFQDIVWDDFHFDAKKIVKYRLPQLLKRATFVPVFKYLREAEYLNAKGSLKLKSITSDSSASKSQKDENNSLDSRVKKAAGVQKSNFYRSSFAVRNRSRIDGCKSISDVKKRFLRFKYTYHWMVNYIPLLDEEAIDIDALQDFIKEYLQYLKDNHQFELSRTDLSNKDILSSYRKTQLYKLICLYDWLKYGRKPSSKKKILKQKSK